MKTKWKSVLLSTGIILTLLGQATLAVSELGLPRGDAKSQGMSAKKLAAIPGKIQGFIDDGKLAGAITAVARNGEVVHFKAFGLMDSERNKPMQPDTIFRLHSMTKPVTGTAIMILIDEGKLSLDDSVSKYIPQFADTRVFVEKKGGELVTEAAITPITVKHLMMHTSGLTYPGSDNPVSAAYLKLGINASGHSGLTLEQFAMKVAAAPLMFQPGTQWNYGVSTDVLGRVIEVVTGQRYGDFLQARVFGPLGMVDSGFHVPAAKVERFAANYARADEGKRLIDDPATSRYLQAPSQDSGGGGLVGTAADYLRFAQMLLNGGELEGTRIISVDSARDMTTNQMGPEFGSTPLKVMGFKLPGVGFGYCGAVVMDDFETTLFGPSRVYTWGGAASTDFWIDHKEQLVGVVLTQMMPTASYPTRRILQVSTYEALEKSNNASAQ